MSDGGDACTWAGLSYWKNILEQVETEAVMLKETEPKKSSVLKPYLECHQRRRNSKNIKEQGIDELRGNKATVRSEANSQPVYLP